MLSPKPYKPNSKPTVLKPLAKQPPQKQISTESDNTHPDFSQVSVFHSISEVRRLPTSGLSHNAIAEARSTIETLIKGTENVSDLIEDGRTTLVFREHVIETSQQDIIGRRFIIYQKPTSDGLIKIKSKTVDDARTEIDENEPFTFRQCTFFLCDTRDNKDRKSAYLCVGIRIASEQKVRFVDCAFVGITYNEGGTKTTGVDFMVFTDCFSKIDLELDNCYFTGPKSVLLTNFAVRSLIINQCTFDNIQADTINVTHPGILEIIHCQFYQCGGQPINIKLFDEDLQPASQPKKTSGFATSTKTDNSVVSKYNVRKNC